METKKKESPEEIKKNVSKKLFAGQMKRTSNDNPPKKKDLNERIVNTSGSYDFADKRGTGYRLERKVVKKERPKQEYLQKSMKKKENVFQSIKDNTKKTEDSKPFFENLIHSTGLTDSSKLKVNKKHQSRVNKILGR